MARILLVDDNEANRFLFSECLKSDNHDVVTAENGRAALAKLNSSEFDLVLTDEEMPVMTGSQLAAMLKESDNPIKVVMMTANNDIKTPPDGVDVLLHKPIGHRELLSEVSTILSRQN